MTKTHYVPFAHTRWLTRVQFSVLVASLLITLSLSVGIAGYHLLGHLPWIDSLLEASMILAGMGPVAPMTNDAVKVFASFYALFSGLILVGTTGLLFAPWLHCLLYHTHRQARRDVKADEQ